MSAILRSTLGHHSSNLGVVERKIEETRQEFPFSCAPKANRLPSYLEGVFVYKQGYARVDLNGLTFDARAIVRVFHSLRKGSAKTLAVLSLLEDGLNPSIFRGVDFYPEGYTRSISTSHGTVKVFEHQGVLICLTPGQRPVYVRCESSVDVYSYTTKLFKLYKEFSG